ncbi:16S rRNA (cytosine(1402)-N(4))-methyltransferase RsmH [Rubellimicrobium sp. CFH 75288]|uniref:16S rRNA (cytosine(1402)-N(4))-methyltransferase RsmH n=1 Tax=Rubellimicrobium sp. CFH 75288 TaxID=2697034 RepID=UPI00141252C4|nr:16S rRNA (cytosine(1402)-N(4))-methyltransferase RsmH [Rubellimicrobium sp. CFH 75288]NAZ35943.1 16S rRNA (cytosine(1402)-N(4))-methyltransferase RsmH [Rubellimicrobium sp. CFH 75288]
METPHVPVLLGPLLATCAPVAGRWLDGTFGAGGYARGLVEAGAERVLGIDRDPEAHRLAASWLDEWGRRIVLREGTFGELDRIAAEEGMVPLDGVVLDLGVSSMQLDQAGRGFSFAKDGPLDMRMSQAGESARDLVNGADEEALADILFHYGEERAARRIARAIVRARPVATTAELAEIVARCLPRPKPGDRHPATRTFQALRIAVNDEYGELVRGLEAAERALRPGGLLAVVTFHSGEDRVVKRFMQTGAGRAGGDSRHRPRTGSPSPLWEMVTRRAVEPDAAEVAANPRSRSARLRVARRLRGEARAADRVALGVPMAQPGRRASGRERGRTG